MKRPLFIFVCTALLFFCEEEESYTPNHHPEILSIGQLGNGIEVLGFDTLVCVATDIDGDSLEYTWSAPAGSLAGSGDTVIWYAPYQGARYPFSCKVSDETNGIVEAEFSIQVYDYYMGSWTVLNKNNSGLSSNVIEGITINKNNVVWIIDDSGTATRYAGSTWQTWNLNLGDWASIDVDSNGNLWAFNGSRINKVDGSTVAEIPIDRPAFGLVVDNHDNIWVGTHAVGDRNNARTGVSKYDGANWTHFDSSNSGLAGSEIGGFGFGNDNKLWCLNDSTLTRYDGDAWTNFEIPPLYRNPYLGRYTLGEIALDKENRVWIGGPNYLICFDGSTWITYPFPPSYYRIIWGPFTIDDANNIWCAFNKGFGLFDGEKWLVYTTENSALPSDYVTAIAIDPFNNKWIGTFGFDSYEGGEGGIVVTDGSISAR